MLYPLGMDPGYRSGKGESVFSYCALLCIRERELGWKIITSRNTSIEIHILNHWSEKPKELLKKSVSLCFLFQLRKILLSDSPSHPTSLELEKGKEKKKKVIFCCAFPRGVSIPTASAGRVSLHLRLLKLGTAG